MAEKVYKSPGVFTIEVDKTVQEAVSTISGIPAGVIGTSNQGQAFVPITVGTFKEFEDYFGSVTEPVTKQPHFGVLAANEWLRKASALTYIKVLGVGDGKKNLGSDTSNLSGQTVEAGGVKDAGFIVGERQPQGDGNLSANIRAVDAGQLGRTYFLGCFMSGSPGSTLGHDYFNKTGLVSEFWTSQVVAPNTQHLTGAVPIIRGVLMTASGVVPRLSSSCGHAGGDAPTAGPFSNDVNRNRTIEYTGIGSQVADVPNGYGAFAAVGGGLTGTVDLSNGGSTFELILNGFKGTDAKATNDRIFSCSFNPTDASYFANVLNTDPELFEKKGHYLYSSYDMTDAIGVVTGTAVVNIFSGASADITTDGLSRHPDPSGHNRCATGEEPGIVFITTSSLGRNEGSSAIPNYEGFSDRFRAPQTPWIVSQPYGGRFYKLFRVVALDDGDYVNDRYKVTISGLDKTGKQFKLSLRDFDAQDGLDSPIQSWSGLVMDPNDSNFIGKVIGDTDTYFDFDQEERSQRLVVEGNYPNVGRLIRVELHDDVLDGKIPSDAIPFGFHSPDHLFTSGSLTWATNGERSYLPRTGEQWDATVSPTKGTSYSSDYSNEYGIKSAIIPPLPFRDNLRTNKATANNVLTNSELTWGIQFYLKTDKDVPNKTSTKAAGGAAGKGVARLDETVRSYTKYFPRYTASNKKAMREDPAASIAESFNRNMFNLSAISCPTSSITGLADWEKPELWNYKRDALIPLGSKSLDLNDMDVPGISNLAKFTTIFQGGFNGVNMFNKDAALFRNPTVHREMSYPSNRGGKDGPTVKAYLKALDVMANTADVDVKLMAIPGIRHEVVSNEAIDTVETRFDAMYIMDIEERDENNSVITGSFPDFPPVASNTATAFKNRALDTNFAAAYFPNVTMTATLADGSVKMYENVPPSVAVLGAYALNDSLKFPWYAPAGTTRGALPRVVSLQGATDNQTNRDQLFGAGINPLVYPAGTPQPYVFGQSNLQAAHSALNRVSVRRLLIELRRSVKEVANVMLFEPNRAETLSRFSALVNPILANIQQEQGIERYKVQIDTTTTTQADIENNTIRGKIFLQPSKTAEVIALTFEAANEAKD
jgi:phage tail sheath protein FI